MVNLTKTTEDYINGNPSIKDAVASKVINYSKLARRILATHNLDKKYFNAILVAARRFSEKLQISNYDEKIMSVLKKSQVILRDKMCRLILAPSAKVNDEFVRCVAKWESSITIIADEEHYEKLCKKYAGNVIHSCKDLVEITLICPPEVENVVGFSAHLLGLLAAQNVNIRTMFGSYKNETIIINSSDVDNALSIFPSAKKKN